MQSCTSPSNSTPLSMFIKQEEITIEETQLQENYIDISAANHKLFDKTDFPLEIKEEFDVLPKKEEPAEVIPQRSNKRKHARRRLPNQSDVKRKNPNAPKLPTPEEQQAEDDFIKKHTRYICDECDIEFDNFRAIKYHRLKAHEKLAFACCGIQHRSRARLYEHVQSLLNPEALKCELCGKSFKSKNGYAYHQREHHASEVDLVFKCNRCPKRFIKEGLLKIHLTEHETLENEDCKCEFCSKCFRNKSSLNKHIKVAHKKPTEFICEVCSKGFYLRRMFLDHHKTHELTAEQLKEQCPVCQKWFKSHSNLQQHMQRHKAGECKCEVCGHVSSNMTSLSLHMWRNHGSNNKQHVCERCSKEYKTAINLKEHVANAHTGEYLYQCQDCDMKFFFRGTLHYHRKKDHPQEILEDHVKDEALDAGEMGS